MTNPEQESRVPAVPGSGSAAVHVVINPLAGGGQGLRIRERIEQAMAQRGVPCVTSVTEGPRHAVRIAEAAALSGAKIIVAVGGDGTVHEVANGILRARDADPTLPAALAVVPAGTGNDFAKLLGFHGSVDRAITAICAGPERRFDAGRAEWDGGSCCFVNAMGTGIDVEVVRQIARSRPLPGALNYVAGLVRALARYRPVPLDVTATTASFSGRIMTIAVANGRCVGGTFHICPDARPDDGLFDICVIRELSLLGSVAMALRIVRGRHTRQGDVMVFRAAAVDIEVPADAPFFFQLDGELHEPRDARSIRLTILPGALRVRLAPPA